MKGIEVEKGVERGSKRKSEGWRERGGVERGREGGIGREGESDGGGKGFKSPPPRRQKGRNRQIGESREMTDKESQVTQVRRATVTGEALTTALSHQPFGRLGAAGPLASRTFHWLLITCLGRCVAVLIA